MTVRLKRQRGGDLREHWYGEYKEDGKRKEINLGVPWKGRPPGWILHPGSDDRTPSDADFEASRERAEKELAEHTNELKYKGRAEHLTERLIESKTGRRIEYARIEDLPARWRGLGRERAPGERYLAACDAVFGRFAEFVKKSKPVPDYLYQVTPQAAAAFIADAQGRFSRKTARDTIKLLSKAFARFLPVGADNPFASFVGRRGTGDSGTIHRKPFTPEELKVLLEASRGDEFMRPLIVTAACTGMRRGDVCTLRWSAVDLKAGMLAVKTSKTSADVEIPIFPPLQSVLVACKGRDREYVFPEAAEMLADNPDGLTWRFKKIVANAFEKNVGELPPAVAPAEIEAEGVRAISKRIPEGGRRARMLDILHRYCEGASLRRIEKEAGYRKATISNDLHSIQDLIGKTFLRTRTSSVKAAVRRVTQTAREQGERAASVRDWHALRATWVTLALAAGVPVELVRRVTGHATVETVLKHYFRPDREQFRAALAGALPGVLTGAAGILTKQHPSAELAQLAARIGNGTATAEEMLKLKMMIANV